MPFFYVFLQKRFVTMIIQEHPKHKGFYISTCGKVFTERNQTERSSSNLGYKSVNLNGNKTMVHRLVAETYIRNPENKPLVCHIDDNPSNNSLENLWWGTHKENMHDMIKKGRAVRAKGLRESTIKKFDLILEYKRKGLRNTEIAEKLGIHPTRVSQDLARIKNLEYSPRL